MKHLVTLVVIVAVAGSCGGNSQKAAPRSTSPTTAPITLHAAVLVKDLQNANIGCADPRDHAAFQSVDGVSIAEEISCTANDGKALTILIYANPADAKAAATVKGSCTDLPASMASTFVARYVVGPNWTIFMEDHVNPGVVKATGGKLVVIGCGN